MGFISVVIGVVFGLLFLNFFSNLILTMFNLEEPKGLNVGTSVKKIEKKKIVYEIKGVCGKKKDR